MIPTASSSFSLSVARTHAFTPALPPNPKLHWFLGAQGFQFAGSGTTDAIRFEIRNTWGNSVILDPAGVLDNDLDAPGASLWRLRYNADVHSVQDDGPIVTPLSFAFDLAFSSLAVPAAPGVSVKYSISFDANPAPPFQFEIADAKSSFDVASGSTFFSHLVYFGHVATDGSGHGHGFVELARANPNDDHRLHAIVHNLSGFLAKL